MLTYFERKKETKLGKATEYLRHEHEFILSVLEIAEDVIKSGHPAQDKFKFGNEFIYFLSIFTDRCHHGKEESLLFPMMIIKGLPEKDGPIGILLQEHVTGKALVKTIRSDVDEKDLIRMIGHIAEYSFFIRNHIAKENNVLFPLADKILSLEDQNEMVENFEIHEEDVVGHGVHQQLHQMIDQWLITYEIKG
jgi:hemerythrin-like domain-containing protein